MGAGEGKPIVPVPGLLYMVGGGVPGDMSVLDGEDGADGDWTGRGIAYGVGFGLLGDGVGGLP